MTRTPWLFLLLLLPSACAANAEEGASRSPITTCSARYRCTTSSGSSFDSRLERAADGRCLMGNIELAGDGKALGFDSPATWVATETDLKVCLASGDCVACDSKDPPPSTPSAPVSTETEKKCTGSPDRCDSNSPGSCSDIRGCMMRSRVRWNGDLEYYCDGSPDDCDELTSENSCVRQGCDWN